MQLVRLPQDKMSQDGHIHTLHLSSTKWPQVPAPPGTAAVTLFTGQLSKSYVSIHYRLPVAWGGEKASQVCIISGDDKK